MTIALLIVGAVLMVGPAAVFVESDGVDTWKEMAEPGPILLAWLMLAGLAMIVMGVIYGVVLA